jgi:hypothetical protein
MIIFGWNHTRTKDYGWLAPGYCPNCDNIDFFFYRKIRDWLTLFWIPVFPQGRSTKEVSCNICGYGGELREKEDHEWAMELVEETEMMLDGELPPREYEQTLENNGLYDPGEYVLACPFDEYVIELEDPAWRFIEDYQRELELSEA